MTFSESLSSTFWKKKTKTNKRTNPHDGKDVMLENVGCCSLFSGSSRISAAYSDHLRALHVIFRLPFCLSSVVCTIFGKNDTKHLENSVRVLTVISVRVLTVIFTP